MLNSLAKVGIRLTKRQLGSFIFAVFAGLIFARVIPFIYPVFFPVLDLVFNQILNTPPDSFNRFLFTNLTFLCSFSVALLSSGFFRLWRKRKES